MALTVLFLSLVETKQTTIAYNNTLKENDKWTKTRVGTASAQSSRVENITHKEN